MNIYFGLKITYNIILQNDKEFAQKGPPLRV